MLIFSVLKENNLEIFLDSEINDKPMVLMTKKKMEFTIIFLLQSIDMEPPIYKWSQPSAETINKLMTVNITTNSKSVSMSQDLDAVRVSCGRSEGS